jgi:hypothetical protein
MESIVGIIDKGVKMGAMTPKDGASIKYKDESGKWTTVLS